MHFQKFAKAIRAYKSYCLLIFIPYLLLVALFHKQLPTQDAAAAETEDREDAGSLDQSVVASRTLSRDPRRRSQDKSSHSNYSNFNPVPQNLNLYNLSLVDSDTVPGQTGARQLAKDGEENGGGLVNEIGPASFRHLQKIDQVYHAQAEARLPNITKLAAKALTNPLASTSQGSLAAPIPKRCQRFLPDSHKPVSARFQPLLGNYLYSAYYDTRPSGKPYIRIIALLKRSEKSPLFCHFPTWESTLDFRRGVVYSRPVTEFYEMCENHAKDYGGWILSCEVPFEIKRPPCRAVLSLQSQYDPSLPTSDVVLPVFTLHNSWVKKDNFGICVPPLFGYIPSTTMIEFIEFNKLLGANHIVFYQHQIPREMSKVLQYYQGEGLITVMDWDLPVQDKALWYHGQLLAINDCLYRGMHRFKYMAFHDVDEFIVPHQMSNWTRMLESLQRHSLSEPDYGCGYSFQSAFFDPLMSSTMRALYDLESDLRTKSFSKVRTKVMVNPQHTFEVGIHHLSKPIDDTCKPVYVEPEVAFVHHYRKCITDFDPKMNCQVFARDESLSRYIPTLRHDVHKTLWILKELEKQSRGRQGDYGVLIGRT